MDIRQIIADHQALHDRLPVDAPEEREAWGTDMHDHLQGITAEIGAEGVSMLIHVALELSILNDDHPAVLARSLEFVELYLPKILLGGEEPPDRPTAHLGKV